VRRNRARLQKNCERKSYVAVDATHAHNATVERF